MGSSRIRTRVVRAGGVALAAALLGTGLAASPARADEYPPSGPCTEGATFVAINSAEVSPKLVAFQSYNVAAGTTGSHNYTLSRVSTVSTSINANTEITASAGAIFLKVSVKVGFSVQVTKSTTDSESTSMTWNFNAPGYYGMYKGTRQVAGTFATYLCGRSIGSPPGWMLRQSGTYTTFANVEEGTITCGDSVPPGSLRELARRQLGC